jgi:hypothetical protein
MRETHAAFGFPINVSQRTTLMMVATIECVTPLLLLLITPKAAPTGVGAGKAASVSDDQPTSPVSAPTDEQAGADTLAPAPANDAANDPSASTDSRADTDAATPPAAVPGAPTATTSDAAQPQYPPYRSRHLDRSVAFTAMFPSLHLADHPAAATPEWRDILSARLSSVVSEQAALQRGAPVSLRVMQLVICAGAGKAASASDKQPTPPVSAPTDGPPPMAVWNRFWPNPKEFLRGWESAFCGCLHHYQEPSIVADVGDNNESQWCQAIILKAALRRPRNEWEPMMMANNDESQLDHDESR